MEYLSVSNLNSTGSSLGFTDGSHSYEESFKRTYQIISAYSPSGSEQSVANILKEELTSKGLPAQIDRVGNVISEIGTGPVSVLLCGHMDTVPGELPVKVEGDIISGRGACDAKGALASLLFAFERLAEANRSSGVGGRVVFAGVTEEERSSSGLSEIIRNNLRADYAIFGEPAGISKVTIGYRGHLTSRIEIITPEVHASAPKLSTNSAELLFELYGRIKRDLGTGLQDSTDKVSVALTEVASGTAHNVIPGTTRATIDIRIPQGETTVKIRNKIEEVVREERSKKTDATISLSFDEPTEPYRVRPDSLIVRAVNRTLLKKGEKMQLISKSGTGDMNTYAHAFGIDAITYGPGEAKLSHTSEEKISVKEILACADVIAGTATELFAMINRS